MSSGVVRNTTVPTAHNVYLHIAAEIGIAGALISFSMVVMFAFRSWRLWNRLRGSTLFLVLVAVSAMMIAGFTRSIFESELALQHGFLYKNLHIIFVFAFQDQLWARSTRDL